MITTEDWNSILFATMMRVDKFSSVLYFLSLFFVGNYIMMNLVIAILVQGCMERTNEQMEEEEKGRKKLEEDMAANAIDKQ